MTTQEALDFLRAHQPMPADSELSEELIAEYDAVRIHFLANKDERCIPLFLHSFGDGDGLGVYQLVENVLTQFPPEEVVGHLGWALQSPSRSIRYWAAELAAYFPVDELIEPLKLLLVENDEDLNAAAVVALGRSGDPRIPEILESARETVAPGHVRMLIDEELKKFGR